MLPILSCFNRVVKKKVCFKPHFLNISTDRGCKMLQLLEKFGDRLSAYQTKYSISTNQVAEWMEIGQSSVSSIRKNKAFPSVQSLYRFAFHAKAAGKAIDLHWLITGDERYLELADAGIETQADLKKLLDKAARFDAISASLNFITEKIG